MTKMSALGDGLTPLASRAARTFCPKTPASPVGLTHRSFVWRPVNADEVSHRQSVRQKTRRRNTQCVSQSTECSNRRVSDAAFQIAQMGAFHPRPEGKLYLRGVCEFSQRPHILSEERHDVHHAKWSELSAQRCPPNVFLYKRQPKRGAVKHLR